MPKKKSHEEFVKEVFELVGNEYEILGIYEKASKKVLIKHNSNKCNNFQWEVIPNCFTTQGTRCPECNRKGFSTIGQWIEEKFGDDGIERYWFETNDLNPFTLNKTSTDTIHIKCQVNPNHTYVTTPFNFSRRNLFQCPLCNSFAHWGISEYGENFLENFWDFTKNEHDPWDITKCSQNKVWIKCQDRSDHPSYDVTCSHFTKENSRCPYCSGYRTLPENSLARYCIDYIDKDFLEIYWSTKNELSPWEIAKNTPSKKIFIKCTNTNYHEDYETTPAQFYGSGLRCPSCRNLKLHPFDSIGTVKPKSISVWSEKNEKSPYEYSPKNTAIVFWKCENDLHDDYERSVSVSNVCDFRCPQCSQERKESVLQEKVRLYLTEEMKFKVLHEQQCTPICINPQTGFKLLYDNEVILEKRNLIIEVHGVQHYRITSWVSLSGKKKGITPEQEFEYIKWKDEYKRKFAISNGFYYLEIPYWTDNEKEDWKHLIINKLKEII